MRDARERCAHGENGKEEKRETMSLPFPSILPIVRFAKLP